MPSVNSDGLPPYTAATVGYSLLPLILVSTTLVILLFVLEVLSRLTLPGTIPVVGSNSLAIAVACKVSPVTGFNKRTEASENHGNTEHRVDEAQTSHETSERSSTETDSSAHLTEFELRRKLAESEIKWGLVKMPRSWRQRHERYAEKVEHLSFGTREDGVDMPYNGCWHA